VTGGKIMEREEYWKTKEFGEACKSILKNWNSIFDFDNQPERLNPEDAKSVCDSPNTANK
jgi:hypothetical protein